MVPDTSAQAASPSSKMVALRMSLGVCATGEIDLPPGMLTGSHLCVAKSLSWHSNVVQSLPVDVFCSADNEPVIDDVDMQDPLEHRFAFGPPSSLPPASFCAKTSSIKRLLPSALLLLKHC